MSLDEARQTVRFRQREIGLPDLSFRMLRALVDAAPAPLDFEVIERTVWGAGVTRETIKQRVKLLREALADLGASPDCIRAVRNVGYRLTLVPEPRPRPLWLAAVGAVASALVVAGVLALSSTNAGSPSVTIAVQPADGRDADAWNDTRRLVANRLANLGGLEVLDANPADGSQPDLVVTLHRQGDHQMQLQLVETRRGSVLLSRVYPFVPDDSNRAIDHFTRLVQEHAPAVHGEPRYREALVLMNLPGEASLLAARNLLDDLLSSRPSHTAARALRARANTELVLRHRHSPELARLARADAEALVRDAPANLGFRYVLARAKLAEGDIAGATTELRSLEPALPFVGRDIAALHPDE